MYKLILFDLGGVLFTNGTKTFIESVSNRFLIPKDKITEVLDGEIGTLYRESKINRDEFWEKALKALGINKSADNLEAEWINSYQLIDKTKEIIEKLSKNYKVYFLSDNVKEREVSLDKKFGFKRLFNGGVFSHEEGIRKPDPRIYKIAIKKAGENATQTIFIDDKESNLVPARKIGMTGVLFETPEKLESDLRILCLKGI